MPESRRRKPKRSRTRQRMAARDGERIPIIDGCCRRLEIELGVGRLVFRHGDTCAALDPRSPDYVRARIIANTAAANALSQRGIGPTVVVLAG